MSRTVDYYFTLVSPWAYIGDALFKSMVRKHRLNVVYRPVDLGKLFPNSGGLPLGQRHPLRASNTGSSNCSAGATSAASRSRSSRTGRSIRRFPTAA